jgi:hypothetical protein
MLCAVAALPLPRMQTRVFFQPGGRAVETVALHGFRGKNLLARMYDKGVESGRAERGELVRPEDQRRFPRSARLSMEGLAVERVRAMFHRRFQPLYLATKGVTVGDMPTLARKLDDLVMEGELSPNAALVLILGTANPGLVRMHYFAGLRPLMRKPGTRHGTCFLQRQSRGTRKICVGPAYSE